MKTARGNHACAAISTLLEEMKSKGRHVCATIIILLEEMFNNKLETSNHLQIFS
jgi:hypothetical protein